MGTGNIWSSPTNIVTGLVKNPCYASIQIGKDPVNKYLVSLGAKGTQVFRTQYDVAVDGSQYVLTAGRGKGGIELTVFDGPIASCNFTNKAAPKAFSIKYSNLETYSSREITVTFKLPSQSNAQTTEQSAEFSGVIVAAHTNQDVDPRTGVIVTTTQIAAEGMWY